MCTVCHVEGDIFDIPLCDHCDEPMCDVCYDDHMEGVEDYDV